MRLDNQTDFPALTFSIVDPRDAAHHVIVARGTYNLVPEEHGRGHRLVPTDEPTGIAVQDTYFGEMNRSSVKTESDLAQAKPRCDVIVIGSAYSPTGEPAARVEVAIQVRRERALGPARAGTLLDRRLVVHGPRVFERRGAGWALSDPEPFTAAELRYEHAFGGELKVYAGDEAADRVDADHRLPDDARRQHPEGDAAPVAHTACRYNPVGVGFLEAWYADAARVERWPAPRVEAPGALLSPGVFADMVRGAARPGERPELTPQGVGVVDKPWSPRLALAGTYDGRWRAERWPMMPGDFDMAYWNGAHPEMQCEHLYGGEVVTLSNLTPPPERPSAGPLVVSFALPRDLVLVGCAFKSRAPVWLPTAIDTLEIDLEAAQVSLVRRLVLPRALGVEAAALVALPRGQES
jgi:hypothetical protein